MIRFIVALCAILAYLPPVTYADGASDEECMTWALRRIVGNDNIAVNVSLPAEPEEDQHPHTGHGRPGKRGAPGPPGPPGPVGPQGACDCVPQEVVDLQTENEIMKDQIRRIRKSSPETFCLLGLKDGTIPTTAISSSYPSKNGDAPLDDSSSWWGSSSSNVGNEWLMVDLGHLRLVTGVVTQGRADYSQWVSSFKTEHSVDGTTFKDVKNADGSELVFSGNSDRNTKVINRFPEPVKTRFVRIYPLSHTGHPSMRFDIIDC